VANEAPAYFSRKEIGFNRAVSHELSQDGQMMASDMLCGSAGSWISIHVKVALKNSLLEGIGLGPLRLGHGS
jgi:hypothetical protein